MIQIIFGEKGTGKTKKILDLANRAAKEASGSVVFIDDDDRYMFDLNLAIRFINAVEYGITGPKTFYGFLCGVAASDHDLEYVFVDGFLNLVRHDLATLEELFHELESFTKQHNIRLTLSVSGAKETLPAFLQQYAL
ncbi:MAG: twitching motility protein PilT [Clostridia bacterium]|nr:twitching motility protein PilT [Clostridia bacterium]